jgi:hypothetical protein
MLLLGKKKLHRRGGMANRNPTPRNFYSVHVQANLKGTGSHSTSFPSLYRDLTPQTHGQSIPATLSIKKQTFK